ncbi:hypothetical protein [Psychrobacter lutiphocae]|uniref:hypothetical protein n=1 Tax=Psychrobacter lutiphocae TaxID=540500 RepID=UPI0003787298|nr:hypothetical protein [Psychrobacter lutiphocae]
MKNMSLLTLAGLSLTACVSSGYPTSTPHELANTDSTLTNQSIITNDPEVTEYPVESVMIHLLEDYDADLFSNYAGMPIKLELETFKRGTAIFEGKSVLSSEVVTDFNLDGEYVITTNIQNFYSLNPLIFHGDLLEDGTYTVAKQLSKIPKQAKVGDSNTFSQQITYADSNKAQQVSSTVLAWSLNTATDSTAWLCMTAKSQAISFDYDYSGSECYEITQAGEILRGKIATPSAFDEGKSMMQFITK